MEPNEEQPLFNAADILNRIQTDYLALSQHITFLTNRNHQLEENQKYLENENKHLKLRITGLEEEVRKKEEIISSMNNLENNFSKEKGMLKLKNLLRYLFQNKINSL